MWSENVTKCHFLLQSSHSDHPALYLTIIFLKFCGEECKNTNRKTVIKLCVSRKMCIMKISRNVMFCFIFLIWVILRCILLFIFFLNVERSVSCIFTIFSFGSSCVVSYYYIKNVDFCGEECKNTNRKMSQIYVHHEKYVKRKCHKILRNIMFCYIFLI